MIKTFKELKLNETVQKGIEAMGYVAPSPIQAESIPVLLEGKDVIGQAQTGTGKTLAFGSVLLSEIERSDHISAIVLSPTRELAMQIGEEFGRIGKYTDLRFACVYGGSDIGRQIRTIKHGIDVLIGTPGRVMDLMRRDIVSLEHIQFFVLDEADEMLNMGFVEDIETILADAPKEKQTILFSATMPDGIKHIAENYMKSDYTHIKIKAVQQTATTVKQYYFVVPQNKKLEGLCRVLDANEMDSCIIFCKTKRSVDTLQDELARRHYHVACMHGDIDQNTRMRTLQKFKERKVPILIATDVAARGIDVDSITHVINYELPQEDELYVHRIGRTGRAGHEGVAFTFVSPREVRILHKIEKSTKSHFEELNLPTADDIFNAKMKDVLTDVQHVMDKGKQKDFYDVVAEIPNAMVDDVLASLLYMNYRERLAFDYKDDDLSTKVNSYERVFVNCGSAEKINKTKLHNFLLDVGNLRKDEIGDITIKRKFSFVDIKKSKAKGVVKKCFNKKIGNQKVKLEIAKEVR
ncbi:DEAD/DEAH box helicase [Sharpea porci]|uniref:DEAD/DEAH box helicase n=1 Tax=Sharpea porci TaxID=2652286 RepID=UPI002A91B2AF|nr:DEAD/DEAH box helicase [Sharpea porci]MDY5278144.1 DEAD/DEAH box helicase [Sharpea porci]